MLNLESGNHENSSSHNVELSSYSEAVRVITSLQDKYSDYEKGFHAAQCVVIAQAYGFAQELQRKRKLMKAFLAHNFFEKRGHKTKEGNILRLTMFFLVKAGKEGSRYHRACTYTRALEVAFDNDQSEEEAQALLEEKGIEWLARKGAKPVKKLQVSDVAGEPVPEIAAKVRRGGTSRSIGDPTAGDEDFGAKNKGKGSAKVVDEKGDKIVGPLTPSSRKKKKSSLIVEMDQEDLLDVLNIPVGRKVRVVVERIPSDSNFKRMKAIQTDFMDK